MNSKPISSTSMQEHGLTLVKRSTGYLVSQWDRHKFLENKVELEMFLKKLGVNL